MALWLKIDNLLKRIRMKLKEKLEGNKIFQNKEQLLYLFFVLFILVQGIVFSFIVPFGQVPDEMAHYEMIEGEFGTSGIYKEMVEKVWHGSGYSALPGNADTQVGEVVGNGTANVKFDTKIYILSFRPHLNIIRHLPAGIGFYLGVLLGLPIITCTHMAEIFATLFFAFMGYMTLRVAPIKKEIFAFCLLIPECVQQCTSVNYDSVLIPCSIFLFAYILSLYYREDSVKWKNIVIIGILSLIILITKPPYVLIALSIFMIPVPKFDLKIGKKFEAASFVKKFWYIFAVLGIIAMVLGVYVGRRNPDIKTMVTDVMCFPDFVSLLYRTWSSWGYYHLQQMVGMFGWIDTVVTSQFILIFFMMMTYLNVGVTEKVEKKLGVPRRILMLVIAFGIILLIEMALQSWTYGYMEWDRMAGLDYYKECIPALEYILGVQGRYWIPCLPLILVGLSGTTERKDNKVYFAVQFVYYILAFINVLTLLYTRFWLVG